MTDCKINCWIIKQSWDGVRYFEDDFSLEKNSKHFNRLVKNPRMTRLEALSPMVCSTERLEFKCNLNRCLIAKGTIGSAMVNLSGYSFNNVYS